MVKSAYSNKLRNPLWQKKRLEILQRDNFTCRLCGEKETELHVHHDEYINGLQPWEYENYKLKTLCKHCHLITEYFKKTGDKVLVSIKTAYEDDYVQFYCLFQSKDLWDEESIIVVREVWLQEEQVTIRHEYSRDEIDIVSNLFKTNVL